MKLSFALALATMTGSASAGVIFNPPLSFTQFDGGCSGETLYTGEIVSIAELDYGAFCISDNIDTDEGTIVSYSKVEISKCTEDKIYEDWSTCDEGCASCEPAYHAYTSWDSIAPETVVGYCYEYIFSMDNIAATRSFTETRQINFSFDAGVNEEDAKTYVEMMDSASCIAAGAPVMDITKEAPSTEIPAEIEEETEVEEETEEIESGASTLAATAAVAMGAVATMLLA